MILRLLVVTQHQRMTAYVALLRLCCYISSSSLSAFQQVTGVSSLLHQYYVDADGNGRTDDGADDDIALNNTVALLAL